MQLSEPGREKKMSKGRQQLDDSLERAMVKDKAVAVANAIIWQGMSEQTKEPQDRRAMFSSWPFQSV